MKSERERQIPYEITYMWNLKKKKKMIQMNLFTKQKQTQMWKNKYAINKGEVGVNLPTCLGNVSSPGAGSYP